MDDLPLPTIDRLLGQTERAARSTADLDDHELARRPRIDGHEVELAPARPDVPPDDRPAAVLEVGRDERFGIVSRALPVGPHGRILPGGPHRRLIGASTPARPAPR